MFKHLSIFFECRILCFSSGALLEVTFSAPGERKMQFQYDSSCLKSISLNLFLRIFGIIVFFLKIWQFTTSRTPPGAPCHLRPQGQKGGLSAKPENLAPGAPTGYAPPSPPSGGGFSGFPVPLGERREGDQNSSNTPRDP